MLTGVHILLSYACLYQCDHCFLHCGPDAEGTFTFTGLDALLEQAKNTKTVRTVCFEGGEPFLFYPLMLEGIRTAKERGFETECVTNAYWAQDATDAQCWLTPLARAGLGTVNVSDDEYHHGNAAPSPAQAVYDAAIALGMQANRFSIDPPCVRAAEDGVHKGEPIVGGDVRFRGRAAEKLVQGLPRRPWREFSSCPDEDLENPSRVHVDSAGNVQLCQGICIGNFQNTPLARIMAEYDPLQHAVCGPLLQGGPARLAEAHGTAPGEAYVDACHLCYETRKLLRSTLPGCLAPPQAYGICQNEL